MFSVAPRTTMTNRNTMTATETATVRDAHAMLTAFGPGLPLDAVVPARIAAAEGCRKAATWGEHCALIRLDALQAWAASLHTDDAYALAESEALMGWFSDDEAEYDDDGKCTNAGDDRDDDGEFMSTPSVSGDRDDETDIPDALEHMSRDGFISIG